MVTLLDRGRGRVGGRRRRDETGIERRDIVKVDKVHGGDGEDRDEEKGEGVSQRRRMGWG